MPEQLQPPDRRGRFAAEGEIHEELEENHDLLDEPVLPLLGLSLPTLVAVFAGGAFGTVSRYLLAAHHPAGGGSFPRVTLLVNLS